MSNEQEAILQTLRACSIEIQQMKGASAPANPEASGLAAGTAQLRSKQGSSAGYIISLSKNNNKK